MFLWYVYICLYIVENVGKLSLSLSTMQCFKQSTGFPMNLVKEEDCLLLLVWRQGCPWAEGEREF